MLCGPGGPAADYRILLWSGCIPVRANPVVAVLWATARTVSLLVKDGHLSIFQLGWLWSSTDRWNPVAALRRALLRAGVVGDMQCWRSGREMLEQPLYAETRVREAWLQRAQCRSDMAKVAAGRPKLKLGEQAIQWGWIRGQVARLHLSPEKTGGFARGYGGRRRPRADGHEVEQRPWSLQLRRAGGLVPPLVAVPAAAHFTTAGTSWGQAGGACGPAAVHSATWHSGRAPSCREMAGRAPD